MDTFLHAVRLRAADSAQPTLFNAHALALAMAAHDRLGAHAGSLHKVAASHDVLLRICSFCSWSARLVGYHAQKVIVVPDDAPTLAAALRQASPWQHIIFRRGYHRINARDDGVPGSSRLVMRLHAPVRMSGEAGAVLRGNIVVGQACPSGSISDLVIEDSGDCCLRLEGGAWEIRRVNMFSGHGAALKVVNHAHADLDDCIIGGDSLLRPVHALVVQDRASVIVKETILQNCSSAALLTTHRSHVKLEGCDVEFCAAGVLAGTGGGGGVLRVRDCTFNDCTARDGRSGFWFDLDRPRDFVVTDTEENGLPIDMRRPGAVY